MLTEEKKKEMLQKMARNALYALDGCNMIAIVGELHNTLKNLREIEEPLTGEYYKHPIVVMYVEKLTEMANYKHPYDLERFSTAYAQVKEMANGTEQTIS